MADASEGDYLAILRQAMHSVETDSSPSDAQDDPYGADVVDTEGPAGLSELGAVECNRVPNQVGSSVPDTPGLEYSSKHQEDP